MQEPFPVGTAVEYGGRRGTVETIINRRDPSDLRLQGYRYQVRIRGVLWSVREASLRKLTSILDHETRKHSAPNPAFPSKR